MRRSFRHGLVIGKFYPPQAGHHHLIRAAARASNFVTVVAMPSSQESIPLQVRLDWLRHAFREFPHVRVTGIVDDVPVDYADPGIWDLHVELMSQAVDSLESSVPAACRAGRIDAVFTSEHYGDELARRFDATSVLIDIPRHLYPVSGTSVRSDPVANWHFLTPEVRAWFCHRVVVVGAESSGTTTLSRDLAEHYRRKGGYWGVTPWVAEYGREYSHDKVAVARAIDRYKGITPRQPNAVEWETDEFIHIAAEQTAREEMAARSGGPLIVCDTDAFATGIWHERYLGFRRPAESFDPGFLPSRLLYILTAWRDVPFEQDGLRDGEHIRSWMHDQFVKELNRHGLPWIEVSGSPAERLVLAVSEIEQRMTAAWQFAEPLG